MKDKTYNILIRIIDQKLNQHKLKMQEYLNKQESCDYDIISIRTRMHKDIEIIKRDTRLLYLCHNILHSGEQHICALKNEIEMLHHKIETIREIIYDLVGEKKKLNIIHRNKIQ